MHETSYAEQIVACVQRAVSDYPGSMVVRVRVSAGDMLALNEASLAFCFRAMAQGTAMENAALEVREVQSRFRCPSCGDVENPVCGACGARAELTGGTTFVVEEIELDDQDAQA